MEEESAKHVKKPLDIDWGKLLPTGGNDEEPLELVIDQSATKYSTMSADQHSGSGDNVGELLLLSDHLLEDKIRRLKPGTLTLSDGGVKLKAFVRRLEEERERRRLNKIEKVADEIKNPSQSQSSTIVGSPTDNPQSSFGKEFSKRIDENPSSRRVDKEFANLACHDHGRKRSNGLVSPKSRQKRRCSPRQRSVQSPRNFSLYGNRHPFSNGDLNGGGSSTSSLRRHKNNSLNRGNDFQFPYADDSRASEKRAVVLVDEEDCQTIETNEHAEKLTQCMKETKIYYPSRDDPDPIIISYADMECLAPEAYLTSTIMNFYIRYLQQQAALTSRVICDYLFFNTYFYEKLKEAVSYKGTGKNTKFVKFRRWWKGVNIFHKAYVLIPIHQNLHWSLVIICIPDKDDESGPIILHLDSLGLHSSRSVFDNIKSFMKEEWNFLNQEVADTDLPIADNVWKHLPRRIEEKRIMVPQQRNDYDCGLFVLFFMERFIVDAPERLVKRKDLPSMFGREWFKPEEASGLRRKIRVILKKEFQNGNRARPITMSSPESENGDAELVSDIMTSPESENGDAKLVTDIDE